MKRQICAVQMHWKISDYITPEAFENKIDSIMKHIMGRTEPSTISLVVFPEHVGTPLVFIDSDVDDESTLTQAIQKLIKENLLKVFFYKLRFKVGWTRALALAKSKEMAKVYFDVFCKMAKAYGVYIVAGSIALPEFQWQQNTEKIEYTIRDGNVYNVSFLIDPDGKLVGVQKKTHLVPNFEDSNGLDLSAGNIEELKVFDTPFGKVGIAICLDCFKDPVIDMLALKGAEILIQPSANCDPWSKVQQEDWMQGCFKALKREKRFKYAINPMMTGCLFDLCFEGQSSILSNTDKDGPMMGYKDLEKTRGFVRIASSHFGEEILFYTIP